jgi:hypothetical protein
LIKPSARFSISSPSSTLFSNAGEKHKRLTPTPAERNFS